MYELNHVCITILKCTSDKYLLFTHVHKESGKQLYFTALVLQYVIFTCILVYTSQLRM
jgi:hypothetical protein